MTKTEKAIRDFCGKHADWWPSATQVQQMLALTQPCPTCEALARTVMLDQTSHDTQRKPLDDVQIDALRLNFEVDIDYLLARKFARAIEAAHNIKENT